jgi:hypothetical protein
LFNDDDKEKEFIKFYFENEKQNKYFFNEIAPVDLLWKLPAYYISRYGAKYAWSDKKWPDFFSKDKDKKDKKEDKKEKDKPKEYHDYKKILDNLSDAIRNDYNLYLKFFLINFSIHFYYESYNMSTTDIAEIYHDLENNKYMCPLIKKRYDNTSNMINGGNKKQPAKIGGNSINESSFKDMMKEIFIEDPENYKDMQRSVEAKLKTKNVINKTIIEDVYRDFLTRSALGTDFRIG